MTDVGPRTGRRGDGSRPEHDTVRLKGCETGGETFIEKSNGLTHMNPIEGLG